MSKMIKNKLALLALAGLGAIASSGSAIAGMMVDSNGGLEVFELNDKNYWFKISGRLFVDQAWFAEGEDAPYGFPSGSQIRSALVTFRGGVGGNWVYKLDINLQDAPGNPGQSKFGEAFIGYNPCPQLWFAVGQVGIPFGLEAWTSGSNIPFMEISLPSEAFSPENGIGLYAEWHGKNITAAGAVYHPGAGNEEYGDIIASPPTIGGVYVNGAGPFGSNPGSDPVGVAARFTFDPIHDEHTVLHSGISGRYEDFQDHANFNNFFTRTEVRSRQSPTIFSNIPPNSSNDQNVWGVELAGRWGPYILQGEYMWANVNRDSSYPRNDLRNPGGDVHYHGYYVMGSWVVTGETKGYEFDSGTFTNVKPKCSKGAWEVLARYSYLDLLDANFPPPLTSIDFPGSLFSTGVEPNDIVGGVHSTTLGVTWWVNEHIRFMANYVYMALPLDDVNGLGLRAQVNW